VPVLYWYSCQCATAAVQYRESQHYWAITIGSPHITHCRRCGNIRPRRWRWRRSHLHRCPAWQLLVPAGDWLKTTTCTYMPRRAHQTCNDWLDP